jgi:hypothetical protein
MQHAEKVDLLNSINTDLTAMRFDGIQNLENETSLAWPLQGCLMFWIRPLAYPVSNTPKCVLEREENEHVLEAGDMETCRKKCGKGKHAFASMLSDGTCACSSTSDTGMEVDFSVCTLRSCGGQGGCGGKLENVGNFAPLMSSIFPCDQIIMESASVILGISNQNNLLLVQDEKPVVLWTLELNRWNRIKLVWDESGKWSVNDEKTLQVSPLAPERIEAMLQRFKGDITAMQFWVGTMEVDLVPPTATLQWPRFAHLPNPADMKRAQRLFQEPFLDPFVFEINDFVFLPEYDGAMQDLTTWINAILTPWAKSLDHLQREKITQGKDPDPRIDMERKQVYDLLEKVQNMYAQVQILAGLNGWWEEYQKLKLQLAETQSQVKNFKEEDWGTVKAYLEAFRGITDIKRRIDQAKTVLFLKEMEQLAQQMTPFLEKKTTQKKQLSQTVILAPSSSSSPPRNVIIIVIVAFIVLCVGVFLSQKK